LEEVGQFIEFVDGRQWMHEATLVVERAIGAYEDLRLWRDVVHSLRWSS
jgi:hypothetical protein